MRSPRIGNTPSPEFGADVAAGAMFAPNVGSWVGVRVVESNRDAPIPEPTL